MKHVVYAPILALTVLAAVVSGQSNVNLAGTWTIDRVAGSEEVRK